MKNEVNPTILKEELKDGDDDEEEFLWIVFC